jgi:metal-responsive CopG/Arc/MetJ family transcriptional regulator
MATTRVTFTFDEVTVARLQEAAARLGLPRSEIVRKAILEFHERMGWLGERERLEMLRAFDELVPTIPAKPARHVDRELAELRKSRRVSGRRAVS